MIKNLIKYKYLFMQLVRQDIKSRYEGSVLGIFWAAIVPMLMLAIYTIIFSEIFKVKWDINTDNKFQFAMTLFCGLNIYNMFSEILSRSTNLIASNQNYVKKIVFPIDLLPVVITFSALFNCIISYIILIITNGLLTGYLSFKILQGLLVLILHIIFCLGIAYLVSCISVYLKDMANLIGIVITVGMYVSPIFFPMSAVPSSFRLVIMLNPMTYTIENMRRVMLYGQNIDLKYFLVSFIVSFSMLLFGNWIFVRAKNGFADIL